MTESTQDQSGDYLSQLVGEGKKFSTVEDLARSKIEADNFINTLKDDNAGLKEELESFQKNKSTEDGKANIVKELREALEGANRKEGNQPLSEGELESAVQKILQGEKQKETASANRAKSDELLLKKADGNKELVSDIKTEIAKQNGLSVEQLESLSETSPLAFAKLIDVAPQNEGTGSVSSIPGQSTSTFENNQPRQEIDGHRTKAYYDAKRKEMSTTKFINDRQLQKQMLADALALGAKFYNT